MKARVELSDVRGDALGVVAPRIDADEDDSRRHDARRAPRELRARVGQGLQRQRADVRAIREAEEQQRELAVQIAKMQRLPLAVDERHVRQRARLGQQRGGLQRAAFAARNHEHGRDEHDQSDDEDS